MKRTHLKQYKGFNPPTKPINKVSKSNSAKRRISGDAVDRKRLKDAPCLICDRPGEHLHHLVTKAAHPELRHEPLNWVKLCAVCHDTLAHGTAANQKRFKIVVESIYPGIWDELEALSLKLSKGIQSSDE